VLRFCASERRLHWSIAIPFLLCYTTALILVVVYNPDPLRPYRDVVSWAHRLSGICLIVLPMLAVRRSVGDFRVHLYNVRQAWIWVRDDIKWLMLMGLAAVSRRIRLPEQGKFNAAQKLNFMLVMSTYPLYLATGLAMWFSDAALIAWLVHVFMAVVATPFLAGHIFMATIPSSSRKALQGMFSGFVDGGWARHHHSRWYREQYESGSANRAPTPRNVVVQPVRPEKQRPAGGSVNPGQPSQAARQRLGADPEGAMAMLEEARTMDPRLLQAALTSLANGDRDTTIRFGREALEFSANQGNSMLAADLFRVLWPNVRDLKLSPSEMRAIIGALMREEDYTGAAKACAMQIMSDAADIFAIKCLLKIAEVSLYKRRAPRDAERIYSFLLVHCPDSPLAGYFHRGLTEARQQLPQGSAAPRLGPQQPPVS
jgi:formate dehydrogenase subunit gamma